MNKGLESEAGLRRLLYFPILHTQTDMGAFSESLRRATIRKLGQKGWKRQMAAVEKMWMEIEKAIGHFDFSYGRVRLYQDGLPVCGKEADIVRDLAEAGSRNHQLVLKLMEKGVTIMGTESSELLVEEYELVKQLLETGNAGKGEETRSRLRALGESLLEKRDQYIASRINSTLLGGERGILFLGMLHSLQNMLDEDIRVIYPIHRPLDHGKEGDDRKRRPDSDRRR